jgi:hypothetical protein
MIFDNEIQQPWGRYLPWFNNKGFADPKVKAWNQVKWLYSSALLSRVYPLTRR